MTKKVIKSSLVAILKFLRTQNDTFIHNCFKYTRHICIFLKLSFGGFNLSLICFMLVERGLDALVKDSFLIISVSTKKVIESLNFNKATSLVNYAILADNQ